MVIPVHVRISFSNKEITISTHHFGMLLILDLTILWMEVLRLLKQESITIQSILEESNHCIGFRLSFLKSLLRTFLYLLDRKKIIEAPPIDRPHNAIDLAFACVLRKLHTALTSKASNHPKVTYFPVE